MISIKDRARRRMGTRWHGRQGWFLVTLRHWAYRRTRSRAQQTRLRQLLNQLNQTAQTTRHERPPSVQHFGTITQPAQGHKLHLRGQGRRTCRWVRQHDWLIFELVWPDQAHQFKLVSHT